MLNLTYTNGEPYHDAKGTPRETEIAFVCDPEAGAGHPEFLAERNHTYSFKWLTAFACPAQPIECVAEDENGKQYDLSRCVLRVLNRFNLLMCVFVVCVVLVFKIPILTIIMGT